jgi:mono/diheme cytochrome c family protein
MPRRIDLAQPLPDARDETGIVFARPTSFAAACACVAFLALAADAAAGDAARGRDLYEQRCGACHTKSVHGRENRAARNFDEIRAWVTRWSSTLVLGWSADEIEDVTLYLNNTYYRFAMPAGARW